MKRLVTVAAVIMTLAACSGGSDDPESTAVPQAGTIPRPTADQAAMLVTALDTIAPGLAAEPDETIENARNACSAILGGSENVVDSTITRFQSDGLDVTVDQADRIVTLLEGESWCK